MLHREDVKQRFLSTGVESLGSTPEELAAFVVLELSTMGKVIRDAGIRAE